MQSNSANNTNTGSETEIDQSVQPQEFVVAPGINGMNIDGYTIFWTTTPTQQSQGSNNNNTSQVNSDTNHTTSSFSKFGR